MGLPGLQTGRGGVITGEAGPAGRRIVRRLGLSELGALQAPVCVNMDFIRSLIWVGWLVWTLYGPDREASLLTP